MADTLAVVGAGRVGRALGRQLCEAGWKIGAVVTRSKATARAAVRAIGSGQPHNRLSPEILSVEVVLVTTPDSAIAEVAEEMAHMRNPAKQDDAWRGKVVLHTSGALDRNVLAPLARRGASTGSLHPLQTFGSRGLPQLEGIFFAIEGGGHARSVARRIVRQLGGMPVVINGRHKPAYHAAGTFAAPHVLGVVETAARILIGLGFSRQQAVRALLPLARQTLLNYEEFGPHAAWTGPVSRGDDATVVRHVVALRRRFPGEYVKAYAALTELGARVLSRRPRATLRRLQRILGGDRKQRIEKRK